MKQVLKVLVNEPVVFLGCIIAAATVLSQQEVIPGWISLVVLGVTVAIQRHFVSPEFELDG